jgi:hypothetical protein
MAGFHSPVEPAAQAGEVRPGERQTEESNANNAKRVGSRKAVKAPKQPLKMGDDSATVRGGTADKHLKPKERLGLQELRRDLLPLASRFDHLRGRARARLALIEDVADQSSRDSSSVR